jgi:predicted molibdopterin-dependent oxidoreductase YjgC
VAENSKTETLKVTVDGRTVEVEAGTTIHRAAEKVGIRIPTLCYHPKVKDIGACRLCMVEVEGWNNPVAACITPVGEGMVVKTDTPMVKKIQQMVLELLLARHPLDCLVCDRGGWCELQDLTFHFGPPKNRFPLGIQQELIQDKSPFVERDLQKCVMCRRCTRVCMEVRGVAVLGAQYRGYHKDISTFFQEPLTEDFQDPYNCEFCGSCVDICPVGALTAKPSKYVSRPWEVNLEEVTCSFCGVGCLTEANYRPGLLVKTMTFELEGGDRSDLCFRGRFATTYVNHPERLTSCMVRKGDSLVPVETAEALSRLSEAIKKASGKPAAAFIGTTAPEEEAFTLSSFLKDRVQGAGAFALDSRSEPEGTFIPPGGPDKQVSVDDLAGAEKLLVIGQDFTFTHPVAGIRIRQAVDSGAGMLLMDPYDTLLGMNSRWWLRTPTALYPGALEALSESFSSGKEGFKASGKIPGDIPGESWSEIAEWLKSPGEVTVVLQKLPGGVHGPLLGALQSFLDSMGGTGWRLCYIPLDADGTGVPLMISAADLSNSPKEIDKLLDNSEGLSVALFLRCDPLGSSWQASRWQTLREKTSFMVSFDPFMTATAAASDLVIPLPHLTEIRGTVLAAGGAGEYRALYPPPEGVAPLAEVISLMAGDSDPSPESPPGETFPAERLREEGLRKATDRASGEGKEQGAPPTASLSSGEDFLLSLRFHRFQDYRLERVEARQLLGPQERLEINTMDAEARGIEDGEEVAIEHGGSRFSFPARVTPRVPPGQLSLPFDSHFDKVVAFAAAAWPGVGSCGAISVSLEGK